MAAGKLVFLGSSAAPGPVYLLLLFRAYSSFGFSSPHSWFSTGLPSKSCLFSGPPVLVPYPLSPFLHPLSLSPSLSTHPEPSAGSQHPFSPSFCTPLVFYQLLTDKLISSTWWFSELSKQHGFTSQAYVFSTKTLPQNQVITCPQYLCIFSHLRVSSCSGHFSLPTAFYSPRNIWTLSSKHSLSPISFVFTQSVSYHSLSLTSLSEVFSSGLPL